MSVVYLHEPPTAVAEAMLLPLIDPGVHQVAAAVLSP